MLVECGFVVVGWDLQMRKKGDLCEVVTDRFFEASTTQGVTASYLSPFAPPHTLMHVRARAHTRGLHGSVQFWCFDLVYYLRL